MDPRTGLSRRERQVVEAVYRLDEATVAEVQAELADPPGYDAVRTTLRLLEEKGVLRHRRRGQRYVYRPVMAKSRARQGALRELVRTFFEGSAEAAALALLKLEHGDGAGEEIDRLRRLVDGEEADE